ncbi:MAG TPA: TetR/AcrR family transcriptional regulator, partial [Streptomyces sp.]|nr:TetR/AcrR family transcriptional regulator [Streptomyces sp.]
LYRERFARVTSLTELLQLGRELHSQERAGGHVAVLAQLLAGAQTHSRLAPATAAGLALWIDEIEQVLSRVLSGSPIAEFVDATGLSRALVSAFVGLELYEGVDPQGATRALEALEQLSGLAGVLEDLGPVTQRAVRARLRRTAQRR